MKRKKMLEKDIMKTYQERLSKGPRGLFTEAFARSSKDDEFDEVPFDSFVFHLAKGDAGFMEKYLEEHHFDVYKSEGIRIQSSKLLLESMSLYPKTSVS